jgi:hypothetical protein
VAWTFTAGAVSATFEPQAGDNAKLAPQREARYETNMFIGGIAGRVDVFGYGPLVFKGGDFQIRCSTADALKLRNVSQLYGKPGQLSDGTNTYDVTLVGVTLTELLASCTDYEYVGTLRFEG